jgi:hypothetical protein
MATVMIKKGFKCGGEKVKVIREIESGEKEY